MIIGQNYVFIHLDKCAGVYLTKFFKEYLMGNQVGGRHANPQQHTKQIQNLKRKNKHPLILGSIRSPYSFYVSLFSYGCQHKNSNYGTLIDYDEKFKEIYSDANNIQNFQYWLEQIMTEPINLMGEPLNGKIGNKHESRGKVTVKDEEDLDESDKCGLLTKLFFRRFQDSKYKFLKNKDYEGDLWVTDYIRVEYLLQDLELITKKLPKFKIDMIPIKKESVFKKKEKKGKKNNPNNNKNKNPEHNLKKFFENPTDAANQTKHHPYQDYYTDSLSELVWEKDNYIFKKFDYPKLDSLDYLKLDFLNLPEQDSPELDSLELDSLELDFSLPQTHTD